MGKPSRTAPPNSSNNCRARSVLRSVVSMGSLRHCASGEHLSPFGPVLHGLGEGAAQGAGVATGADGPQGFDLDLPGLSWEMPSSSETSRRVRVSLPSRPWRISMILASRSGRDSRPRRAPAPTGRPRSRVVVAGALVREQLAKLGAFVGVDLRIDAGDGLADLAQAPGLLRFYAEPLDDLLSSRRGRVRCSKRSLRVAGGRGHQRRAREGERCGRGRQRPG